MTSPPPTRREAFTDTLHGVAVDDPYRWLEDGENAEVQQWAAAQNLHTRAALDARPDRKHWHDRLVELMGLPVVMSASTVATIDGVQIIATERLSGADQFVLTKRSVGQPRADPDVLFDPSAEVADGALAIDWFHPSQDGSLVALGVSEGGTEQSTLRVLDVQATLAAQAPKFLSDRIPNTRACSLSWEHDGAGFVYTRNPAGDQYHRTVHSHRLGADPANDPVVWAEHATPETWPDVELSPDGRWALVHAMVGWGRIDVYVLDRLANEPSWTAVIEGRAATSRFTFGHGSEQLVGMTTHDAPMGRIVEVRLDRPAAWRTLVAERDVVIGAPVVAGADLLVVATTNAVDELERFTASGAPLGSAGLGIVAVQSLDADRESGCAIAVVSGFESPTRLVEIVDGVSGAAAPVELEGEDTDLPELVVTQVSCPSADGVEIGMFLVHRADLTPGPNTPTVLTGYGGFGIALSPGWSPSIVAWCEQGGLYAVAGLRGGVEHGEAWHHAGRRALKQNVFDDFHAAADWLVDTGRTSRERLGIDGRSNGGLLVGVALTQRPDLCAAVSCGVPLLDMIRFPNFLIARLWTDEFGDPDVAEEFAWLHAYSPYHHVENGVEYPATFIWTADGDSRVDPLHARKMAAQLQAATGSDRPVLLHQEGRAGHGVGKPVAMRAQEQADVLAFFSWQLDA